LSNLRVHIPPESLTASQRLQTEGAEVALELDPVVLEPDAFGLAVDVGTTKVAAYLVRLGTGETVARSAAMNPQIAYGEDVISRIAYAGREVNGAKHLQSVLAETLNGLVAELCATAHTAPANVLDAVMVGNTAMHHLLAGLPVTQLGVAPYAPATTDPLTIPARDLDLALGTRAQVYLPPVIAGYVGADHLAMLLATGISPAGEQPAVESTSRVGKDVPTNTSVVAGKNLIALDIGTNTEIALLANGQVTCCSCA
jgi:uncharacterized 2Fe-2S/4Fe-4S cluster protein (DUF4445 family)